MCTTLIYILEVCFHIFLLRSIQHIAPSHTWSVFSHICRHFPLLILSSSHLITYTCTCCFIIKGFYDNQHSWRLCNTISVLVAANWSHFVFPLGCHGTQFKKRKLDMCTTLIYILEVCFHIFLLRSIQHSAPSHTWSVFSHICRHFPLLILSSSHSITYTRCVIIKGLRVEVAFMSIVQHDYSIGGC